MAWDVWLSTIHPGTHKVIGWFCHQPGSLGVGRWDGLSEELFYISLQRIFFFKVCHRFCESCTSWLLGKNEAGLIMDWSQHFFERSWELHASSSQVWTWAVSSRARPNPRLQTRCAPGELSSDGGDEGEWLVAFDWVFGGENPLKRLLLGTTPPSIRLLGAASVCSKKRDHSNPEPFWKDIDKNEEKTKDVGGSGFMWFPPFLKDKLPPNPNSTWQNGRHLPPNVSDAGWPVRRGSDFNKPILL